MSFDYTRILADYSAAFPSSAVTPLEVKNLDDNGYAISGEAFTVPASPDGDGLYRVNLDQIPLEQSSVTITVNSGARTVVPINEAPSAGQVALSTADGSMIFNSADAGLTGAATYTGRGTPIMAHHFHLLQKELAAVEGWLLGNGLLDEVMAGIDGVDATTFTLDSDNAGAGASAVTLAFNRGTDGGDARLVWNETSDRFEFSVTGAGTALDLWMGNLLAVDGTFSGDLDCNNATGTGNFVRANSPTLVTPSLGVASATSITTGGLSVNGDAAVTGEIDAGSIALDGTEIVDASRNLDNIANVTGTGNFVRATSPTLVTPNIGAATGTSLDASSFVDAAEGFRVNGIEVIADDRSASFAELSATSGAFSSSISAVGASITAALTGTSGAFSSDLTTLGDVGVGTASPSVSLHITAGGTTPSLDDSTMLIIQDTSSSDAQVDLTLLSGNGASAHSVINFGDVDDEDAGVILYNASSDDFRIRTGGGATEMYIESGVGLTMTTRVTTPELRLTNPTVPSTASDTGTAGDLAWDGAYLYVCTATDTWVRAGLATW